MKAKLILLENPVIVTDEEIITGDLYIDDTNAIRNSITSDPIFWAERKSYKKIISNKKSIDYNGIDFGIVDVEKLAIEEHKYNHKSVNEMSFRLGFIEGFNASQKLNEKKFSRADMIECFNAARRYRMKNVFEFEFAKEYLDNMQPETFDIEIEETSTHIKILRKLC